MCSNCSLFRFSESLKSTVFKCVKSARTIPQHSTRRSSLWWQARKEAHEGKSGSFASLPDTLIQQKSSFTSTAVTAITAALCLIKAWPLLIRWPWLKSGEFILDFKRTSCFEIQSLRAQPSSAIPTALGRWRLVSSSQCFQIMNWHMDKNSQTKGRAAKSWNNIIWCTARDKETRKLCFLMFWHSIVVMLLVYSHSLSVRRAGNQKLPEGVQGGRRLLDFPMDPKTCRTTNPLVGYKTKLPL